MPAARKEDAMEWLALAMWIIVAAIALPLGRHALGETAVLGLQALAGGGGLALCALFLAVGRPSILAWGATALAFIGLAAVTVAAVWLASDARSVSAAGQGAEETDALLAGLVLPLFGIAALFSLLMALDVGMVG
jgi:hypothetical protein